MILNTDKYSRFRMISVLVLIIIGTMFMTNLTSVTADDTSIDSQEQQYNNHVLTESELINQITASFETTYTTEYNTVLYNMKPNLQYEHIHSITQQDKHTTTIFNTTYYHPST